MAYWKYGVQRRLASFVSNIARRRPCFRVFTLATDVEEPDLDDILVPLPPPQRAKEVRSALSAVVRSGRRVCGVAASWRKAQDGAAKGERRKRKRERRKERGLVKKAKVARDQLAAKRDEEDKDEEEKSEVAAVPVAAVVRGKRPAEDSASDPGCGSGKRPKANHPPSVHPQAMSPPPPPRAVSASPSFISGRPGLVRDLMDQCNISAVPTPNLPPPVSLLLSSRVAVVVATSDVPSVARSVITLRTTRQYSTIHLIVSCPCLGVGVEDFTGLHNSVGDVRNGDCVTVAYSRAGDEEMLGAVLKGLLDMS